jgi:quinone-modifying oxidoreductase subunit QmoB
MSKIKETLDRLMLESDRIRVEQLAIDDYGKIPSILEEFTARLEELGPNPYKGY